MFPHNLVKHCQKTSNNDKLQGDVATCLRCDGVAKSASDKKNFTMGEYLAKLQARTWLSCALCALDQHTAKDEESARDNHVLACNFAKYSAIKKFTGRLRNKPFLIWLSTAPAHLKYVATLPCNL